MELVYSAPSKNCIQLLSVVYFEITFYMDNGSIYLTWK